jgi:vacuolar-type H+-ATPase subunit H
MIKQAEKEAQEAKDQAKRQAEQLIEQAKKSIQKQHEEIICKAKDHVETMKHDAVQESAVERKAILAKMKKDIKHIQEKAQKNMDKAVTLIIDNLSLEE